MTDSTDPGSPAQASVDDPPEDGDSETVSEERSLRSLASRGALWAVLANITMRFASIAVTAVLARILSPDDFGVFAVAMAVFLVVSSLAELGMGSAVARSAKEPDDIAPTVTLISIIVSGVIAAVMAIFAPALALALGQPAAAEPIRILSLCLMLTGIFAVPGAQLVREFRQDRIFLATVVGFVVANPILIVLALNGGGATAFAWSRVIGQLATGIVFILSTQRRYLPGWRSESVGPLIRFGLPLSVANLVNLSLLNADYLILGRLVEAAQVGVYMIAFNVASWSTAILGSVLNSVVVPAFGRVSEDRAELGRALLSATQLVGLVAMPIGAMTLALSAPLIRTVFGAKWTDAAPVLTVLSIYGVLYAFSLLYANVLIATGKTLGLLVIQIGWVATLVPAIVFGLRAQGLVGVAWAHVMTIGLVAVPAYALLVLRITGQRPGPLVRAVARPLLAAVLAGCSAWIVAQVLPNAVSSFLLGGLTGCVVYLVLAGPLLARNLPGRFVPGWLPQGWRPANTAQEQ